MPPLLDWQREVMASAARFQVLAVGRRGGKTMLGAVSSLAVAAEGGKAWWVAPTYQIAQVGWRAITHLGRQIPGVVVKEADRQVTLPGGGWVQVRSADNPNSLRGEGLNLVVADEAAFIREEAWTEALRPTLSDRMGRALLISTPKGLNWFWQAYERGRDPLQGEWRSWQLPTSVNPHIRKEEIEEARRTLPERVFAQEYLAEFISDAGAVFENVLACATSVGGGPERGHTYVVGADWAKSQDYSAFAVLDVGERRLVRLDRSNRVEYMTQVRRMKELCDLYRPAGVVAERNSIGEPVIEQLLRVGVPVTPWTATNATKRAMVERLKLAFERQQIRILPDPVLMHELQAFESELLPSGLVRYGAPSGMHDDTVIALGLAWLGAGRPARRTVLHDFAFRAG